MMHKLCAKNWALAMQLLLHIMCFMDKVEAQFGLPICSVLAQSGLLETVHTVMGGDGITVIIIIVVLV